MGCHRSHIRNVSTHSLTRRLTTGNRDYRVWFICFNSQPHEEADQSHILLMLHNSRFNSQPHEEADSYNLLYPHLLHCFNSQPHEEADNEVPFPVLSPDCFNSQPHEEADGSSNYE